MKRSSRLSCACPLLKEIAVIWQIPDALPAKQTIMAERQTGRSDGGAAVIREAKAPVSRLLFGQAGWFGLQKLAHNIGRPIGQLDESNSTEKKMKTRRGKK